MNKAPIALFVFNRFDHVKRTLEALTENHLAQSTDIIVYSDGPKVDADQLRITQIRQYLKTLRGFKSVRVIERSENFGLSRSIIQGVTEVLETYGRVVKKHSSRKPLRSWRSPSALGATWGTMQKK